MPIPLLANYYVSRIYFIYKGRHSKNVAVQLWSIGQLAVLHWVQAYVLTVQ